MITPFEVMQIALVLDRLRDDYGIDDGIQSLSLSETDCGVIAAGVRDKLTSSEIVNAVVDKRGWVRMPEPRTVKQQEEWSDADQAERERLDAVARQKWDEYIKDRRKNRL